MLHAPFPDLPPTARGATGLALALTACGGDDGGDAFADADGEFTAGSETITVGGATFTESSIMMEMYRALLEDGG